MRRFQLQRVVQVRERLFVRTQIAEQIGSVVVRLVERRGELDGGRIVGQRLLHIPRRAMHGGPIEVVVAVVGIAPDGLVVVGQRTLVVAHARQHLCAVVTQHRAVQPVFVRGKGGVGDLDGPVDLSQRTLDVTAMQVDQCTGVAHERAEEHPVLGLVRRVGERDRGVDALQGQVLVVLPLGSSRVNNIAVM